MAKLTNKQAHEIRCAIADIERGIAYLKHPSTAVCFRNRRKGTTTSDYDNDRFGDSLTPVDISTGSDIVGFYHALVTLRGFLEDYRKTRD
ncbi:hypothetical protein GWS13_20580 [Salmonella enterica]|nr:hypothetical protein [Salmonella enterica]EHR4097506.1 hypothetical protein [Salmonella enterica subsp. enterica serovar Montevideo]EEF7919313.1 hypothetical protein [Salmonella enterica]EEG1961482.1 hypothetical protein [Salmonella enterica]EKA4206538.1 hypothetical protein [Salmonella enterica]